MLGETTRVENIGETTGGVGASWGRHVLLPTEPGERRGLAVNALNSGSRGRGFEPHSGQTVLCP